MELCGKTAFITGSASGIGKGYAEALLSKGMKVFLSDVDESTGTATLREFEEKFGSENVRFLKLDVSNESQFEEIFKEAVKVFGQIDIMINNAGIINEGIWQIMIQINFFGVVKGTKLAEEHMRKDKGGTGGRIINISSIAGLMDHCTLPVYNGTKHAVRSFTLSQAGQYDLEAKGIEYGVICPNIVDTKLIRDLDETRMHYCDRTKKYLTKNAMPVARIVGAFMELIQLEKINGAILLVNEESNVYQKLEIVDLGPTYKSAVV